LHAFYTDALGVLAMASANRFLAAARGAVGAALMAALTAGTAAQADHPAGADRTRWAAEVAQLALCLPPREIWQGQCVNKCPAGQFHAAPDGRCQLPVLVVPSSRPCLPPNEVWLGRCVARCPLGQVHTVPNGKCQAP
jgi:hypothetical protein